MADRKVLDALERLEQVYAKAIKTRMAEKKLNEAIRLQWKRDGVKHAIEVVKNLGE